MTHNSKQASFECSTGAITDNSKQREAALLEKPDSHPLPKPGASQSINLPQASTQAHPQYQQQLSNTGMAAGATVGVISDGALGSPVGDMVIGGVVGGMVGQKIVQEQNHAFWRDKAMEYREGRATGTIPPPNTKTDSQTSSWFSKEGRVERRAKRWERRAKRRDNLE